MIYYKRHLSILAAISLAALCFAESLQSTRRKAEPVVKQVDHILVQSGDPAALFGFFTETLELPVAWPLSEYEGFTSGGIGVETANLEILRYAGQKDSAAGAHSRANFMGLAFEPAPLKNSLPELTARGIAYNPLTPYQSSLPDGSKGTSWTIVTLPPFSKPNLSIFLCEYSSAFLNVEIRRRQLGNRLALNQGGPLAIESIKEIVVGTRDLKRDRSQWENLFMPIALSSGGVWQLGNGPAIRLVSSARDGIQQIVIKVRSLEQARAFLDKKRWLKRIKAQEIAIHPSRLQGLSIHLVER